MKPLSELENSQSSPHPTACTAESFLPETPAFRKSRSLLGHTIDELLKGEGVSRVLFVTLTFPKRVHSPRDAHKKLNSLLNAVRKRYDGYLWVMESHGSGSIHYHLLIPVGFDCHDGTDLDAWGEKFCPLENMYFRSENLKRCGKSTRATYLHNSMNPALQAEDNWWRAAAKDHGFGRVQVAPIYRGAKAVRKYLTKAEWRTRPWSFKERKNVRFWSCSREVRAGTSKFSWNTPRARQARERMAAWAKERGCESPDDLRCVYGSQWGYLYMREMVWGVQPKNSPEPPPPATCPFPRRRYSDPNFRWHPSLYASAKVV